MKKLIIILIIFCVSFLNSCEKWYIKKKLDCVCYSVDLNQIVQDSSSNNLEEKYFNIWKTNFISRNNWSDSDYTDRIVIEGIAINDWNSGSSLRVDYYYKIDWAVIKHYDNLMIKILSTESAYGYMEIPRDEYLDENWVLFCVDNNVFNSTITSLKPDKKLKYPSCEDACAAINAETGFESIDKFEFSLYVPGKLPRVDG